MGRLPALGARPRLEHSLNGSPAYGAQFHPTITEQATPRGYVSPGSRLDFG
jgi:hypothetical protein